MHSWKKAKIADIADTCLGKMLDKKKNKGTPQQYLANLNVRWGGFSLDNLSMMRFEESEQERYGLKYGDIVMCEGGEPGRCAIWREEIPNMKIQKALHRIRVRKGYDAQFLYYRFLLAGRTGEFQKHFIGSTIKHLTGVSLRNVEFEFPPLEIQHKISAVLSSLDAKIALNQRINAELEALAQRLYQYWFVQFDFPYDFERGQPDPQGQPYKSSGGEMVYSEALKREIPKGWGVGSLWDIADYFNGLAMQKYRPADGEESLRVIKIREMNEGFSHSTEFARLDLPEKAVVENGDILFSWSATLDVKMWSGGRGALNQHIFKVTSDRYPKSFYYYQLKSYLHHFKMMAEKRKTTMGHITQDHLKQSRIPIPPIGLTWELEKVMVPIFEQSLTLYEQSHHLSSLRDWLLPMLMNGQVQVGEGEEMVGEAIGPDS